MNKVDRESAELRQAQLAEIIDSIWGGYECHRCGSTGIVEEPRYGRFAVEATRPIPCPACCNPQPAAVEPRQTVENDDDPYKPEGGYGTFDFDGAA